jgi:hypothetical protein
MADLADANASAGWFRRSSMWTAIPLGHQVHTSGLVVLLPAHVSFELLKWHQSMKSLSVLYAVCFR